MRLRAAVAATMVAACASITACSTHRPGGSWSELDAGTLATREGVALVGVGAAVVAWGGLDSSTSPAAPRADGALFDVLSGTWSALPPGPLSARHHPAVSASGDNIVIVGGSSSTNPNDGGNLDGGAHLDLGTSTWSTIAALPPEVVGRIGSRCTASVMTSEAMIVPCAVATGGLPRYLVESDRWDTLALPAGCASGSRTVPVATVWKDRFVVACASPDDRMRVAVSGPSDTWMVANGPAIATIATPSGPESNLVISSDDQLVDIVDVSSTTVYRFDPASGSFQGRADLPRASVNAPISGDLWAGSIGGTTIVTSPSIDVASVREALDDQAIGAGGTTGQLQRPFTDIDSPDGVARPWQRWQPLATDRALIVVSEPDGTHDPRSGHRLWRWTPN